MNSCGNGRKRIANSATCGGSPCESPPPAAAIHRIKPISQSSLRIVDAVSCRVKTARNRFYFIPTTTVFARRAVARRGNLGHEIASLRSRDDVGRSRHVVRNDDAMKSRRYDFCCTRHKIRIPNNRALLQLLRMIPEIAIRLRPYMYLAVTHGCSPPKTSSPVSRSR